MNDQIPQSPIDAARAAIGASRAYEEYDVPPSIIAECNEIPGIGKVTTIGMVLLTGEEELMASQRGRNNLARTATEMAKAALYMINGKQVNVGTNTDMIWSAMHPKLRALIAASYIAMSNPTQEEQVTFLVSKRQRVG